MMELPLPAAAVAAVSKLMGSAAAAAVTVEEVVEARRESGRLSLIVGPSVDTCSSILGPKDDICTVNAQEPAFWNKTPNVALLRCANQLSSLPDEDGLKEKNVGSRNKPVILIPTLEAKQLQQKPGKAARRSSGFSKRSQVAQMEVSVNETEADDIKGMAKELGLAPVKRNITEKMQMVKQKSNLNGKRGDKKNGKVSKSRCDSFSAKVGLVSFSSAAGGNNIFGVHGSKSDIDDVTKHVEELSLNQLLDDSYKCPSFAKEKGKKAANANENLLNSVREACSILRLRKPIQHQNLVEIVSSNNCIVSTSLESSGCSVSSRNDSDRGDAYPTDASSSNKIQDSCTKLKTPASTLDSPLYESKDILERLALPPPKDLECLLLDGTKPVVASRSNSDLRSVKPLSHRGGLPHFPWSHTASGHCKSISDAVKLSTSRTTCQGRWVKMGSLASPRATMGFLAELESLSYDQNLVPTLLGGQKSGSSESDNATSISVSLAPFQQGLSSSATCSIASHAPRDGHCPRLLAAAQTLCDIATYSLKQNPPGMMRWPKKPSQKSMRAVKVKSNEKTDKIFAPLKSKLVADSVDEKLPLKKPRLVVNEKSDEFGQNNTTIRGPISWSTPRSSRSSPSKIFRDPFPETKSYNPPSIVKKSCMMPPPSRMLDKACSGRPKPRKLVPTEWNWAGGKAD